jgi:P27 family predicted phage terminase small subunit
MGKRGPKPIPTALRIHRGLRIRKETAANEPKPTSSKKTPRAPDWLGKHGQAEWRRTAPKLHVAGCLTDLDVSLFALYCHGFDSFNMALDDILVNGIKITARNGGTMANPAVKVMNDAAAMIHKFGIMFGLAPTARVGLSAPVYDLGADDLENFKAS